MKLDKNSRGSLALVYVISAVVTALLILFVIVISIYNILKFTVLA